MVKIIVGEFHRETIRSNRLAYLGKLPGYFFCPEQTGLNPPRERHCLRVGG